METATRRARDWLAAVVAVDLRSLALFRIAIALVCLADLAIRAGDLVAFHTEGGILTRAERLDLFGPGFGLSAYDLAASSPALATAWFLVAAAAALALLLGWQTRAAALVCWISVHGLLIRMPAVVSGGDLLLSALLLFSVFAPLGARFSVDAARSGPAPDESAAPRSIAGAATLALLAQMVMVSVFGGAAKLADPAWRAGDGVTFALHAELFTTELAHLLRQAGWLMAPLNHAVIAFEIAGPLLLLAPRRHPWLRFAFAAGFVFMNVAFWLCLRVGIFSWVAVAGAILFVPGATWDALGRLGRLAGRTAAGRARLAAAAARIPWAAGAPRLDLPRPVSALVVLALLVAFSGNIAPGGDTGRPLALRQLTQIVALEQQGWPMFAPTSRDHGWFLVPGRLADGTRVDLWRDGAPVDEARPPLLSADFPSYRWRKLMQGVRGRGAALRPHVARYFCRRWNRARSGPRALVELELVYLREETLPGGATSPVERLVLYRHVCVE